METMRIRRAPKLLTFLVSGAVIGAVAGIVMGVLGPGALQYTRGAIVGFFLVLGVVVGAGLGAVLGLVLDRVSLRRSRGVTAQVADVHTDGEHPGS